MALATKPPIQERIPRRIWKTPGSKVNWLCLAISLLIYGCIYIWYLAALKTQPYAGPYSDPLRLFGIVAFCLVLAVTAYTLRRRFMRRLPGGVQHWLWLHTWFGILSILVACLHENYANILHDFYFTRARFTEAAGGTSALYALLLLVVSGIAGRLLDSWQAHVIAQEASSNGVGIVRALQERLFELDLAIERFKAAKSPAFKSYCAAALGNTTSLPALVPLLAPNELDDFEHVREILTLRIHLLRSLQRQQRAHLVIRVWRSIHIPLACIALAIISYHSIAELLRMLPHIP